MRSLLRPLPRAVTRPLSVLLLIAWVAAMAVLVNRSYLQASSNLATDLARYGSAAEWRGVYYRGEKIGFTVSQTVPNDDGFELQEDGRLQMSLLGATTRRDASARPRASTELRAAVVRVLARSRHRADRRCAAASTACRLTLDVTTASGTRTEVRELAEPPALSLNLVAPAGQRRPGRRRAAPMDGVRSGDAAQRAGQRRGRQARAGARRRRRADPGVPRRDGVRRPADDVVGHRHRRGRARGEPAGPDHRARVGRAARGRWRCRGGCRSTCSRRRRSCRG